MSAPNNPENNSLDRFKLYLEYDKTWREAIKDMWSRVKRKRSGGS